MWKIKGIVLTAPLTGDVNKVARFIREYLAPRGFNTIVMQMRYRYRFNSHPEVCGYDPLSYEDVKTLLGVCRECGITLIPKMNLIGHQSGFPNEPTDGILHGHNEVLADTPDGLLKAHPEFDEQKNTSRILYARSICLSNQNALNLLLDLIDELMSVFESNDIHIGCDEGFNMGLCEKCSQIPKYKLFANWVNKINDHVKAKDGQVYIWGDRLVSVSETGYNEWEASDMGTEKARELLSKDIIVCDWHYNMQEKYPSVDILGEAGFNIMVCPWRDKENAEKFINYAKNHDKGHVRGILATTWCNSGELAGRLLDGEECKWIHTEQIAKTIEELY